MLIGRVYHTPGRSGNAQARLSRRDAAQIQLAVTVPRSGFFLSVMGVLK